MRATGKDIHPKNNKQCIVEKTAPSNVAIANVYFYYYFLVSFSDTPKQLYYNDMKYGTDFYVVILCQVYKSSVRFNTNTTSFKK